MQSAKLKNTEQGLTLLECLVGIMVVGVIVSAITPALLIAYASRVQNYRTEQAVQAAQAEINRVRLQIESGKFDGGTLPPKMAQTGAGEFSLDDIGPPNQEKGNCPQQNVSGSTTELRNWCGIDTNNDGNWDLAVQSFRSATPPEVFKLTGTSPNDYKDVAFLMGVRVYTIAAVQRNPSLLHPAPKRNTASGLTDGAKSISLPLVTLYAPIVSSDIEKGISRRGYCELIKKISTDTTAQSVNCNE